MKQKLNGTGLQKKTTLLSVLIAVVMMVASVPISAIADENSPDSNVVQVKGDTANDASPISNAGKVIDPKPSSATYASPSTLRILIYADDPYHASPNTYIDRALQSLGLGYTAYYDSDFTEFNVALTTGGPWDLVIFGQENWADSGGSFSNLKNYVDAGGRLIARSWIMSSYSTDPLWSTMGVTFISNDYDPPNPIYWWNPAHPIFAGVPQFTSLTDGRYGIYGQYTEPLSTATALAGYTTFSSTNNASLILRNDGKTLFMGFMDGQNDADLDSDGVPDGVELWKNAINNILAISPPSAPTLVRWSVAASTGAVDEADTRIFTFNGPYAYLKSSAPLPANLDIRYNVPPTVGMDPSGNKLGLKVRYRDNGGSSRVRVYLKEYNVTSGSTATRMTFDSNSYTQSSSYQTRTKSYCDPGWTFDFNNKVYYIETSLNKTASTGNPGLAAIQLTESMC